MADYNAFSQLEDDYLPNTFEAVHTDFDEDAEQVKTNTKELENIGMLGNSKGWEQIQNYIEAIRENSINLSKIKKPEESLESYGAKRLAADAVYDALTSVLNFVEASKEEYNKNINK